MESGSNSGILSTAQGTQLRRLSVLADLLKNLFTFGNGNSLLLYWMSIVSVNDVVSNGNLPQYILDQMPKKTQLTVRASVAAARSSLD